MHGNVWEWVQDWYGSYTSGTAVDPAGPSSGSGRVRRGGSWSGAARYCRSAFRYSDAPGTRGGNLGVRLLRVAQ
jgi:formylglycine-generating enzyme required for sulfatase activity